MNWVDVLLAFVVILGLWGGWQRGFINGTASFFSWAGSFVCGYFLYPFLVPLIERFTSALGNWVQPVAFISMVILARIVLNLFTGFVLRQTPAEIYEHSLNKAFGMLPGGVNGLLQAVVVAALLLTVPVQNKASDTARESKLAAAFAPPAFWLAHKLAPIFSEPLRTALPKPAEETGAKEFIKLPFTVSNPTVRPDLEAKMLELVNKERVKEGLKPLSADPEMQAVARRHSKDMFKRGYFAHINPDEKSPFDRMDAMHVKYHTAGENLALAQTLQQAHDGLMKSPGHRANILQPRFGRLGIGILDGGIYGLMVTQNFRN